MKQTREKHSPAFQGQGKAWAALQVDQTIGQPFRSPSQPDG